MHVHFVHCEIFDVEHWNITQRCNRLIYNMVAVLVGCFKEGWVIKRTLLKLNFIKVYVHNFEHFT